MKIFMTGATGLLGNELGQQLVRMGHDLLIVTRSKEEALAKLTFPCEVVQWTKDGIEDHPAFANIDTFIHLAGEGIADKYWTEKRKQQLFSSRVHTAEIAINKLKQAKARVTTVLTASGINYYGDRGDDTITENDLPGEDFTAKLCVQWEDATKSAFTSARWVALRTPPVLSKKGGYLEKIVSLFLSVGASALGDGRQFFSFIHVRDWVRLAVFCLDNERVSGPINAVTPKPLRNSAWTKLLSESLSSFRNLPVPRIALRLVMGDFAPVLTSSQRAEPTKALNLGFHFEFPSAESALHDLFGDLRPGELRLSQEQWIPQKPNEAFEFFASEKNLEIITPEFLNFHVKGKTTAEIQAGTLIDYQLKVRGIPMHWQTKIASFKPGVEFSDEQIRGPYKKWFHHHGFEEFAGGTLLKDDVVYQLPLGWIGRLTALSFVQKDVKTIFNYRSKVIAKIFRQSHSH